MKIRFLLSVLAIFGLAACSCNTKDETSTKGGGRSKGYTPARKAAPRPAPTQSAPEATKLSLDRVFYAFDSFELTREGKETLKAQAKWMQENPHIAIVIEGNCDERGTREYNIGLGARRANAAREFLIARGVSPHRMTVTSYGKDRPSVPGSTPEAWAQNRNAITRPQ